MRSTVFCITILLLLSYPALGQQHTLSLMVEDMPLSEALTTIESQSSYLFSFKETDIQDIRVSVKVQNAGIRECMEKLLRHTGLSFELAGEQYVILRKTGDPVKEIPDLSRLCGTVRDSLTGDVLPFASIYFTHSGDGVYGEGDGSFSFSSRFLENDTLAVSYAGYETKYFPASFFTQEKCPAVYLDYLAFSEDFIVVMDYLTDGIDLGDNGASTVLRPNRIGALPGQAEPDVFSTIRFLPGISAPSGEASGMIVRGGAADQNLILWEDIPIYHPAHYFGMISAFNPYVIDKISVYRGGFGPEYGGRVSSVIDMRSPGAPLERTEYGAGFNFLNGYAYGKVPVPGQQASIVYSVRRSLSEIWRSPTFENITQRNQQGVVQNNLVAGNFPGELNVDDSFDFLDTHIKTSARMSDKDDLSLSFFYANNDFDNRIVNAMRRQEQIDVLDLNSHGTSLSWTHDWNGRSSTRILGLTTRYDYDYAYELNWLNAPGGQDRFGVKTNEVGEQQLHLSHRILNARDHEISLGYQFTRYDVNYQIRHETDGSLRANEEDDVLAGVHAVYGAFSSPEDQDFGMDAGVRLEHYGKNGNNYVSPRIRMWYNLNEQLSLQANAGRYYQFVAQLVEFRGDFLGIETPIWVLAGEREVPVLDARQLQLGFVYHKNTWVVDVQAYRKKIDGLTSLATGFDPTPQNFDIGSSSARGIDVLVKKRWKKWRLWASYSLSKTGYHFERFFDPDFAAPFDQRHIFNLVAQATLDKFQFSFGMQVASGMPYSVMEDFNVITGPMGRENVIPVFPGYNNRNLPARHQLDASVLYRIEPRKSGRFRGYVGLSLFNLYDHENVYDREYYVSRPPDMMPRIEVSDQTGLGFTPNAVVRFVW